MATTKPQGTWIEFADRKSAEDMRAKLDAEMGYPRVGTRVSAGGYDNSPVHVTEHYAPIVDHPSKPGVAAVFVDVAVDATIAALKVEGDADALKLAAPATLDATWEVAVVGVDVALVDEEVKP